MEGFEHWLFQPAGWLSGFFFGDVREGIVNEQRQWKEKNEERRAKMDTRVFQPVFNICLLSKPAYFLQSSSLFLNLITTSLFFTVASLPLYFYLRLNNPVTVYKSSSENCRSLLQRKRNIRSLVKVDTVNTFSRLSTVGDIAVFLERGV